MLIVFTQELFTNNDIYTIDQNPLAYLFTFLNDGKTAMDPKSSINKDELDSLTLTTNSYQILNKFLNDNFLLFINTSPEPNSFINQFLNNEINYKIKTDQTSISQEVIDAYGVFNIECKR